MTYQECLDYFYSQLPMYHRTGAAALKANLDNIRLLCSRLDDPQTKFRSIHVAGTNGKGSSSHMIAAVLQSAGYKTGLYTSPHIADFRERVRINGTLIPQAKVVSFAGEIMPMVEEINPSFFELTVALAFWYFAEQSIDVAVIEVGLGGRLDSTNIINPLVSLITNISLDHSYLLGNDLKSIAREKAGIIKPGVPVVIGEKHPETIEVFVEKANSTHSEIYFAQEQISIRTSTASMLEIKIFEEQRYSNLNLDLGGAFQRLNLPGVLMVFELLNKQGFRINHDEVQAGLEHVAMLTGIKGRWQTIGENPKVICDTGHNIAALTRTVEELKSLNWHQLHMVLGFVKDKDIAGMLDLLPKSANYYFCAASVPRSLEPMALAEMAGILGLSGRVVPNPNDALNFARKSANKEDLIFVGGSTFVVAELDELNNE